MTRATNLTDRPTTADREPDRCSAEPTIDAAALEGCLDRIAQAISSDPAGGAAYLPIYERLESELRTARLRQTTWDNVNARLRRLMDRKAEQFFEAHPVAIRGTHPDHILADPCCAP